jgi:hypothetical protein
MVVNKERTRSNRLSRTVRVTLPISVACDLEKFQRALANVARLVGSDGGASETNLTFLNAREFVVDPASLQVRETAAEL